MLQGGRALRPRGARDAEPAVPLGSAGRARRHSASRSVGLRQDRRGGRAPRQRLQVRAGGAESGPPARAGPGDHASGGLASGDTRTPHWRRQNPSQLRGQGLDRGGRRGRPPWPRLRGAAAEPEAGSPAIGGCGGCPKLSELADAQNGGIVVPGAQGDGTAASASASSRPTSGVDNLRSRAAACSDANHQVTLALDLDEDAGRAAASGPTTLLPPSGCAICGSVDAFGGTMLCACCEQALCPDCYPLTQHEPCCSVPRLPSPNLELAEHTCERCSRMWLCLPPAETHADCEFCADDTAPSGLVLLGSQGAPPVGAPPTAPDHWSESHVADYLRQLTVTEAATLFRRSRTMSERCLADIASVSMTETRPRPATTSHRVATTASTSSSASLRKRRSRTPACAACSLATLASTRRR